MDEFDKALKEAQERCRRDPQLSVIDELRKCSASQKWQALLDDMNARNTELRANFVDTHRQHVQIHATPETGEAIASYHQDVVIPLLGALLNELTGIHAEFALHKMQLGGDKDG